MKITMLGGGSQEEINRRLRVVASAGALSRSSGTVTQVYESKDDFQKNLNLARAVVGYGHRSIAEHDYLVFAIEDVTPIVEQTLIGYRLTSFTIKSRRNVDFRDVGFYVPEFCNDKNELLDNQEELKELYNNYMKSLFDKYGELVDKGLPIEDCRYVLPYSYHSNIIMGCDANEFFRMTADLLYGKNSNISELQELGLRFKRLINDNVPYLACALNREEDKDYYEDKLNIVDDMMKSVEFIEQGKLLDGVHMTNYTKNADWEVLCNILMVRKQLSRDQAEEALHQICQNNSGNVKRELMQALIHSKNQRELEQVLFSFEFPIELAVLTHITRHRMQSLLVPDFAPLWNFDNYMIPNSIMKDNEAQYREIYENNKLMVEYFKKMGVRDEDLVYFYLSGNACNVYTTMNASTLEWISRMRCCTKAQEPIRNIVNEMVNQASSVAPLIGEGLGPSCKVLNTCNEGKDSCKNRGVVVKKLVK